MDTEHDQVAFLFGGDTPRLRTRGRSESVTRVAPGIDSRRNSFKRLRAAVS